MKTNPVYKRECMVSARSFRLALVLLVFNGILALVALLNMYSALAQVRLTAEVQYTGFLDLYMFVASLEFLMLILIMPALTAGSISGERERQTLDMLLATKMKPWYIVLGKLESSLSSVLMLAVSSLPVLSIVFIFGGVGILELVGFVVILGVSAVFIGSVGIFFSAYTRRVTTATVLTYLAVLFLLILLSGRIIKPVAESYEKQKRFITDAGHELKTPITSILGFTELMTSGVVTDPIQKAQYLERIGEEGRRMSNLIDDILRLSSLESKQAEEVWERVDLRGLCEDIFRSLEPIMKKRGITGEIFGAAHYYAYPDDMRQLLKNLMENAVKYNRENGRVTVRISPDAYQCVISVVDTGIGIPLEHQSRVFERFYRVDKGRSKREGGTGLGLSIVKHITAKYAGQITLVSRPDKGTSIRVTLPVTEEGRR